MVTPAGVYTRRTPKTSPTQQTYQHGHKLHTDNRSTKPSLLATSGRLYVRRCHIVLDFTVRNLSYNFRALRDLQAVRSFHIFIFQLES